MKRCLVFFVLCTAGLLFAQVPESIPESVLNSFLSKEQQTTLLQDGRLLRSAYNRKDAAPQLAPPFAVPQLFSTNWNKGSPTFLIEALYLYKKARGGIKDTEKLSRILRSVSKLEGLQYYSSSRKKMRTLYERSYLIESPKNRTPLEDPLNNPSADFSVYVLQKDLTFGKNIYRYRFCSDSDSSGFLSTNNDVLKYSVFKAVEPGHLQASLAVTDLGDYLLIYALTEAQFSAPSVLHERVQNSFRTRGEAVYTWFISQYEAEAKNSGE